MTATPPNPREYLMPLPAASQLREALELLGLTVGGEDSDEAPALAGVLYALAEQYKRGLDGADYKQFQAGWLSVYDGDERRALTQVSASLADAGELFHQGVTRVPDAARPLRIAALGAKIARWSAAAAAETAGADSPADYDRAETYLAEAWRVLAMLDRHKEIIDNHPDVAERLEAGDPGVFADLERLYPGEDEEPQP